MPVLFILPGVSVSIRCGAGFTLYADGVRVLGGTADSEAINIIPKATRIVVVFGQKYGSDLIAAGFSNGFKTLGGSEKWKCSDHATAGVWDVGYDDSGWSRATNKGSATDIKFVTGARKIWTAEKTPSSDYVYCRGYISE